MSNNVYDLLVLGWGKAGKTLAKKAALKGQRVAIVERDPKMFGGTCINIGCLPTKAMVHFAGLARESEKLGVERDWAFNERAFAKAQAHRAQLVAKLNKKNYHLLADEETLDIYVGEPRFTGPHTVVVTGATGETTLEAQKIIINTGSTPRELPIEGLKTSTRVHQSTSILELAQLPKRLLVIGAGYIGLEFASYFRGFGSEVHVYQHNASWLPREDRDVAQMVSDVLAQQGVQIHFNTVVKKVADVADGVLVTFEENGETKEAQFDQVLVAAGRVPNIAGLHLEAAGVALGDCGEIKVDSHLRTSVPHIWAAGDVKGGPQFTFVSLDDFRIIHPQLMGLPSTRTTENRKTYAVCTFLNPPLARVGYTEAEAQAKGLKFTVKKLATMAIPKAHTIEETAGMSKVLIGEDGKILGATLYHYEAHEMINLITLAMNEGLSYEALRDAIYTHPTYTESLNDLLA